MSDEMKVCAWPHCRGLGCAADSTEGNDPACPEYNSRGLEEAEERMYSASEAYRKNRQESLLLGCLMPFGLIIALIIAALANAVR